MSSPRTQSAPGVARPRATRQASVRPKPAASTAGAPSDEAKRLAAEITQSIAGGNNDVLSPQALQSLMAALCRLYAAQAEAGADHLPIPPRGGVTASDVMVVASGLLKAVNLAVFELGMWQSWTGR